MLTHSLLHSLFTKLSQFYQIERLVFVRINQWNERWLRAMRSRQAAAGVGGNLCSQVAPLD